MSSLKRKESSSKNPLKKAGSKLSQVMSKSDADIQASINASKPEHLIIQPGKDLSFNNELTAEQKLDILSKQVKELRSQNFTLRAKNKSLEQKHAKPSKSLKKLEEQTQCMHELFKEKSRKDAAHVIKLKKENDVLLSDLNSCEQELVSSKKLIEVLELQVEELKEDLQQAQSLNTELVSIGKQTEQRITNVQLSMSDMYNELVSCTSYIKKEKNEVSEKKETVEEEINKN